MTDVSVSIHIGVGGTLYGFGVGNWPWHFQVNRYERDGIACAIFWAGPFRMTANNQAPSEEWTATQ